MVEVYNPPLFQSAEHAKPAPESTSNQVDEALNLKLISVRLQEDLVKALKEIALKQGLGYQPLIRNILTNYVSLTKETQK